VVIEAFLRAMSQSVATRLSTVTPDLVPNPIDASDLLRQAEFMTEEIQLTTLPVPQPKAVRKNWIIKFMIVGGSGAILNTTVLYALYRWLHVPLVAASALSVELAVVNNYLLNDRWTFGARSRSIRRFAKFNASSLAGLAVNVLSVWLLTRIELHFLLANLAGIAAAFAINFALSATWVWGRRS
jgi:putative flippase GtrA